LNEELEIDVPRKAAVKLFGADASTTSKAVGDRQIYILHASHMEREKERDKDHEIPDWEKNAHGAAPAQIRLSSFDTWAKVGSWYRDLQKSKLEVTPQIRHTAEDLVKGQDSDAEKIKSIYEFVSSHFRYIAIDLGAGRYSPHTAADVLGNRYGDCKDKHTLFAALLSAVGVQAYPALVSTSFKIDPALPSASMFNHVITAIPQGEGYLFLDTTPEVAPYGLLLAQIRDRDALVIPTDKPASLVKTTADPPAGNGESYRMDAVLDISGTLNGKAEIKERGDAEVTLRQAFRNTPQNKWDELIHQISLRMGFRGTVSETVVTPPERIFDEFGLAYKYHRPDYSAWSSHQISLPFPPMFLPELNEAQKKSDAPVFLGSPQKIFYESTVKLPEGITPTVSLPDVDQKSQFADYTAHYRYENGTLHGTRELQLKLREVPAGQRAEYSALVKAISDDLDRMFSLSGDFESESPLAKSRQLQKEGKNAEAIGLLEKASEDGEEKPELRFALGSAYLKNSQDDKAANEFQKLTAEKPSAILLNDIAYEYAEVNRHLGDATEYVNRALAETSAESLKAEVDTATQDDYMRMRHLAAQWDTLGWLKFRGGDAGGAEKYVQASWLQLQSAVVGEHLAEIYEKLGRKADGDRACRLALAAFDAKSVPGIKEKIVATQLRINFSSRKAEPPSKSMMGVNLGGIELSELRATKIPLAIDLPDGAKSGIFAISVTNGEEQKKALFIGGDSVLKGETEALSKAKLPLLFPDEMPAKLLRRGLLSCSKYTKGCTFVLLLLSDPLSSLPAAALRNERN
jgi:tetratricopeptide (TPR) repeat protein